MIKTDQELENKLIFAVVANDKEKVKKLISLGADIFFNERIAYCHASTRKRLRMMEIFEALGVERCTECHDNPKYPFGTCRVL